MRQKPKQIGNMKKVLSIILAVFCFGILSSNADNDPNVPNYQKPNNIIIETYEDGIHRSVHFVRAVLNINTNTIEIDFAGLGDGEIYIIDSYGNRFDNQIIYGGVGMVTMPAPVQSDIYTLIIRTDTYYGEGVFFIE